MPSRRVRLSFEVFREAGVLIAVLYPLEKSMARQADWLWILLMELFAATLIVCGIIFDREDKA